MLGRIIGMTFAVLGRMLGLIVAVVVRILGPVPLAPLQDDADTAMDTTPDNTLIKQSVLRIASAMNSITSQPFILVGGGSLVLYGSSRITNDVDFLVSEESFDEVTTAKAVILEELAGQDQYIASIDLLKTLNDRFEPINFQSVQPYAETLYGVRVPQLDVLLGAKIIAHFGRPDGEAGDRKRGSDIFDIHWISMEMKKRRLRVRRDICDLFICGPYNMLLVLDSLYGVFGVEGVELFESVGGREFECDWGNTAFEEQAGFYLDEIEMAGYSEDDLTILGSRRHPNFLGNLL